MNREGSSNESDSVYRERVEVAKSRNIPQLLFKAARLVNECGIKETNKRGLTEMRFRAAHTGLFPHITLEGTRLTDLARRVGLSKQAVGQLVAELVDMGSLEQIPDPHDGRAKLIRFSRKGQDALMQGLAVLADVEADLRSKIGSRHMKNLHAALIALLAALEGDEEGG